MSISSLLSSVERLEKDIASLNGKLSDEYKKESDSLSKISGEQRRISKNTSTTTLQSIQRRIESENKKITDSKKKQADITKQISSKQKDLAAKRQQLQKEQSRETEQLLQAQNAAIRRQKQELAKMQSPNPVRPPSESSSSKEYDFFISYASEDKEEIARPLYHSLTERGATVWMDDFELSVGDSLRKSLDKGLAASRHGIVILSKTYMQKFWTGKELDALFSKASTGMEKAILPIWHNISVDAVRAFSPMLLDYIALKTADLSIEELTNGLMGILKRGDETVHNI